MRKFFSILICISCLVCLSCGSSTNGGEVQNKTCTITFHANNGTGITKKQTTGANVYFNLDENTFTYSEHSFNGWNTSENGTGKAYSDKEKTITNINLNLYAQWKGDDIQRIYTAEELADSLNQNSYLINNQFSNIITFELSENNFFTPHSGGRFENIGNGKISLKHPSFTSLVVFKVSGTPEEIILTRIPEESGDEEENRLFITTFLVDYSLEYSSNMRIPLKKTVPMRELNEFLWDLTGTYVMDNGNTISFSLMLPTEYGSWETDLCRDGEENYSMTISVKANAIYLYSKRDGASSYKSSADYYVMKDNSGFLLIRDESSNNILSEDISIFPPASTHLTKI